MKMENLDQFMGKEKNFKKFVRDMGEHGSSLMLRVIKKLPADYELNASNPDALTGHASDAIDRASLSPDEIKELAGLNPRVYLNNEKAKALSLMHLLIVDVAKDMREPVGELVSVGPSPSQERVNSLVSSLLLNLEKLNLDELLDADLESGVDEVLMVSARSSPDPSGLLSGISLTSSNTAALPQSPSSAATSRERVANYRKGTSVPASPRGVSRESSGEDKAGSNATSTGNFGRPKPMEKERSSAPVSRESSGSDLEDSSGATSNEQVASTPAQRSRSVSQRNMVIPQSPRTFTHKRVLTGGAQQNAPASPEKGSPDKTQVVGQPEKKQ